VQFPRAKLLIFAKAPEPGRVKTRLAPALGFEAAAQLYQQLLIRTVELFSRAGLCEVECWCAPDARHPLFQQLAEAHDLELQVQQGLDLGERMGFAAQQALHTAESVVLIGADCPVLATGHLLRVLGRLQQGCDAVLGPAEDGGYVLLGLNCYHPSLFSDMAWGEDQVLAQTRVRMERLGWRWEELEPLWDLDRPEDLVRYRALTAV
jgi:hypothetical protein